MLPSSSTNSFRTTPSGGGIMSLKSAQYGIWIIVGFTLFAFVHLTLNSLVDRRIDHAISQHRGLMVQSMDRSNKMLISALSQDGNSSGYGSGGSSGSGPGDFSGGFSGGGSIDDEKLLYRHLFNNQNIDEKPTVPISLVIPCQSEDFYLLPMLLESLANQTIFPYETLVVLNLPPNSANGTTLLNLDFEFHKLQQKFDTLSKSSINIPDRKTDKNAAKQFVLDSRVPIEYSIMQIPNLKLLMRSGKFYAGSNRMFGARQASNQTNYVSFFDCDDYLHPKRTEYVYRTFQEQTDLEALIHGFSLVTFTQWDDQFTEFHKEVDYMPENKTFLWPYDTLWKALPVDKFKNETDGEPRQTSDSLWFFPRDMKLPRYPPYPTMGHNAWITLKKEVLDEVPYPETLPRGQDSLYNWRLLVAKKRWNHLPLRLAAYVRPR